MGICYEAIERWWNEGLPRDVDVLDLLGIAKVASFGVPTQFLPELSEWLTADEGESELFENEAGGILRKYKQPRGNVTQIVSALWQRYPLRDRQSWDILKAHMDPYSAERQSAFTAFLTGSKPGKPGKRWLGSTYSGSFDPDDGLPILCTILMPTYWLICTAGFENTIALLYEDRSLVAEILDFMSWFLAALIKPVFDRRIPDVVFLNEEAAFKEGPIMSPRMYREIVLPYVSRVAQVCVDAGVPFVFCESGGDVTALIDAWLEAGISGILPVDAAAGCDPVWIRRRYPHLSMIGGINRVVLQSNVKNVKRVTQDIARTMFETGRSIPCADGHFVITEQVSFENMRVYRESIRASTLCRRA